MKLIGEGITESNHRRNLLWKQYLANPENIDSRRMKELLGFIANRDTAIVHVALSKITQVMEDSALMYGDIYRPFTIGLAAFEYPEGN